MNLPFQSQPASATAKTGECRPVEGPPDAALDRLIHREEILQICFWYQGEGLGEIFDVSTLQPFLRDAVETIQAGLEELVKRGLLQAAGNGFRLTETGRREGGRLFSESFSDFQRPAHGECEAGCCDGDDHTQCGDDCHSR